MIINIQLFSKSETKVDVEKLKSNLLFLAQVYIDEQIGLKRQKRLRSILEDLYQLRK